jgi:hypothetical protein
MVLCRAAKAPVLLCLEDMKYFFLEPAFSFERRSLNELASLGPGVRKVSEGEVTADIFALTTEPNAEVGRVLAKAMPSSRRQKSSMCGVRRTRRGRFNDRYRTAGCGSSRLGARMVLDSQMLDASAFNSTPTLSGSENTILLRQEPRSDYQTRRRQNFSSDSNADPTARLSIGLFHLGRFGRLFRPSPPSSSTRCAR